MKHKAILTLLGGDWTVIIEDDELISCRHGVSPQGLPTVPGGHPILCTLRAYADGNLPTLNRIPVTRPGGEFHTAVRGATWRIPPGRIASYSELTAMTEHPTTVRAAAGACTRNRMAVVVPYHRVIRGDGDLSGYVFGLEVKQALPDFERRYA